MRERVHSIILTDQRKHAVQRDGLAGNLRILLQGKARHAAKVAAGVDGIGIRAEELRFAAMIMQAYFGFSGYRQSITVICAEKA